MEEYKLDDKELAALEKLYDFPARSTMASSKVRAVNIIDTLSEVARTPEARSLAHPPPPPPPPPQRQAAGGAKKLVKRRSGGASGRQEGEAAGSGGASGVPAAEPTTATLNREAIIAKLLDEAARSPPPPIPTRRPDLSVLNIRAENTAANNAASRGKLPLPPSSRPEQQRQQQPSPEVHRDRSAGRDYSQDKEQLLDDLYGRIKGRRPHEVRRTPDWIRTIFDTAKQGDINELRSCLSDMEPTLIRNLSDHHGNNLAHVLAACGHVQPLAWLVDTCGHVLSEALSDENKHGMTPSVAAVRCGKLEVIQWMVENTIIRDRLFCREGERSLLHAAAKYGQVDIAAWCVDRLLLEGRPVDQPDHHGDTPLHLAAKTGNTLVAQKLLDRGANVTAKNDVSLKPYDLAAHHGHRACAEYLLTYEALSDLSMDFTSLEAEAGRLQKENADYKNNFREVLSVSRKLLREREDMCKDLSRLHESTLELHEQLLGQLGQLAAENQQLQGRLEQAGELAGQLHVRWQHCQRAWFSAPLADTQHRILMAEQAWKRLRASRKDTGTSLTSAQEILRNKIGDIRAQSAQTRFLDSRALSSSENSLVDSELYQQISPLPRKQPAGAGSDIYGPKSLDGSDIYCRAGAAANGASHARSRSEVLEGGFLSEHESGDIYGRRRGGSGHRRRPGRSVRDVKERRGKSVEKMERLSVSVTAGSNLPRHLDLSKSLDFDDSLLGGVDEIHNSTFVQRARASGSNESLDLAKEELRRKLRDLALVSDTGSASVLEVIEPSGSEAGSTVDLVQREIETQRRALQARSRDSSHSRERRREPAAAEPARDLDAMRARRDTHIEDESDFLGLRTGKPHRSRPAAVTAAPGPGPGLGMGTTAGGSRKFSAYGGAQRRLQRSVAAAQAAAVAAAAAGSAGPDSASVTSLVLSEPDILQGTRRTLEPEPLPDSDTPSPSPEDPDRVAFDLESEQTRCPAPDAISNGSKKRGFLQKFAMKARWNNKKKERPLRPGQELSAEEFRETYLQDGKEVSLSSQDLSVSELSSGEEKKRLSVVSHVEAVYSETSDTERRSKRGSVASRRESDTNEPEQEPTAARAEPAAAAGPQDGPGNSDDSSRQTEASPPPPPLPPPRDTSSTNPASAAGGGGLTKPKVAPKPSSLPRRLPSGLASGPAAGGAAEDVVRPASSASRPESAASTFPPYKGFPLTKSSSLSTDQLPSADSSTNGRHSPAPSEISKTESALSPPSHASDVSKTESTRHLNQLDKIEELRSETAHKQLTVEPASAGDEDLDQPPSEPPPPPPTAATSSPEPPPPPPSHTHTGKTVKRVGERRARRRRDDRPWYEVSDDDTELPQPGRYTAVGRSSSEEDATELL